MKDMAAATTLIQVAIGDKGLNALLDKGLTLQFDKHAVTVQIELDDEIKQRLIMAKNLVIKSSKPPPLKNAEPTPQ